MIIQHSRHNLDIKVPDRVSRVGLKISGGADSAIVGYLLSTYVVTERPDLKIVPITVDQEGKAFQLKYAKEIINFYKSVFGDIYLNHQTAFSAIPESENYIKTQEILANSLYENSVIQFHFAGITSNPPPGSIPSQIYDEGWVDPPDRNRTAEFKDIYVDDYRCLPLINFDKKDVAELYYYYGVFDTLFPRTRSCESYTDDFSEHCGTCWFCAERKWGFGIL